MRFINTLCLCYYRIMYEGDEINSFDGQGTFDRPGAIMSSSPDERQNDTPQKSSGLFASRPRVANPNQNYLAAQKLASNQNAPKFFREAAMSSAPAPVQNNPTRVNKMPFIIGGVAIIAITIVVIVIATLSGGELFKGEIDTAVAGKTNTAGLFDKDAPIPYRGYNEISSYGYVSPKTLKMTIPRSFSKAGPFYGSYASAVKEDKHVIINRKGEVVVDAGKDADVSYDIDNNVWLVGKDIYNGLMKKANPSKTDTSYSGHGYAFVVPQTEEDNAPYLVKVETGEKTLECQAIGCGFIVSTDTTGEKIYIVASEFGKGSKIYKADSKSEVYAASSNNPIVKISDGVFAEKSRQTKDIVKYIVITGEEVNTSKSEPKVEYDYSISRSGNYFTKNCTDGFKIVDKSDSEVIGCELWQVWELSKSVYKKFEADGKHAVLFLKEDGVHLYDLKKKEDIKLYKSASDVQVYENSAFIKLTDEKGKMLICNVFEPKLNCIKYEKGKIKTYPTFLTIDDKTYTYELKEVKNADQKE